MNILLIGYGAMNQRVERIALSRGHNIVGVISRSESPYSNYQHIDEANADVAIDFSNPELILPLLSNVKTPIVVATTGASEEIQNRLKLLSQHTPIFYGRNMSYGVHVLNQLIHYVTPLLNDYDVELVESHHNRKVDAPSGTLYQLLETIKAYRDVEETYNRQPNNSRRSPSEVGIHAIRGGSVVGDHNVMFLGDNERIEISHQAESKDIFAQGAIKVAEQLINKENGFYTFDNL